MTFQPCRTLLSSLLLLCGRSLLVQGQVCSVTSPAVIKGNQIFNSDTGEHIPIKGIAYRPRPNANVLNADYIDYFVDEFQHIWGRDIPLLQELGVNAVRLYNVDPSLDHDEFMCALDAAGIYALVGLGNNCEGCDISDNDPPLCYPPTLKTRGQSVIQAFSKYTNVLGFSAGNQANLNSIGEAARLGVCQKKFIRDMRSYMQSCESNVDRAIPIGVVSADVDRADNAQYFGCRSDPDDVLENAEFYGLNVYLHCDGGATDIEDLSAYNNLKDNFDSYELTVPVMLTELGCLHPTFETIDGYEAQRNFLQLDALYSPDYVETFAGGFVHEYTTEREMSQETSPWPFITYGPANFGVGYLSPEDCDDITIPCEFVPFPQFDTLKDRFDDVDTSDFPDLDDYEPAVTDFPDCPDNFPLLEDYVWVADSVSDIECPAADAEGQSSAPSAVASNLPTVEMSVAPTTTAAPSVTTTPAPTASPTDPPTESPVTADVDETTTSNDDPDDEPGDDTNNVSAANTQEKDDGGKSGPSRVWRNLLIACGVLLGVAMLCCFLTCCCGGTILGCCGADAKE